MEDTLLALQAGRSVQVGWVSAFLVKWPESLGAGTMTVELYGTLTMEPLLATS